MKKTELITEFVRVATSGKTADGREIEAKHLKEMAESYDRNKYTAQIWLEHSRLGSPYGQVVELRAEDVGEKTELFARLAPSKEMIWLNQNGTGLFTSIEITPEFSDTGKAYLTGLAITDSPASLGTTQLAFNQKQGQKQGQKNGNQQAVIFGENCPFHFHLQEMNGNIEAKKGILKSWIDWAFSVNDYIPEQKEEQQQPELQTANTGNQKAPTQGNNAKEGQFNTEGKSMTQEQIQELAAALAVALANAPQAKAEEVEEKVEEIEQIIEEETFDTEEDEEEEEDKVYRIRKKAYNKLKAKAQQAYALEKRVKALEQKFSQAVTNVPNGANGINNTQFKLTTAI